MFGDVTVKGETFHDVNFGGRFNDLIECHRWARIVNALAAREERVAVMRWERLA